MISGCCFSVSRQVEIHNALSFRYCQTRPYDYSRGGGGGGVPPWLNTITVQCTPYIIIVLRANKSRAYENL